MTTPTRAIQSVLSATVRTDESSDRWREDALCAQVDPEVFFPETPGPARQAKELCRRCPVRNECLEYALTNRERFGIWGGLSGRELRVLLRARDAGRVNDREVAAHTTGRMAG